MNISDLKAGASDVELEATVVEKQEPREVITKYGKRLNVASITLKDDTGTIAMSLWGKDIETVAVGDKVKVTKGYVGEFKLLIHAAACYPHTYTKAAQWTTVALCHLCGATDNAGNTKSTNTEKIECPTWAC